MVGDPIILDWRTWLRGMSSGTELDDGGFSPDTEGVNLISQPGVMHAPAASVDGDGNTTLAGEIVIHIPDNDIAAGGDSAALVSDTGRFYTFDGTNLSAVLRTDGTQSYATGYSQGIVAFGEHYITSKSHLCRWDEDAGVFTPQFAAFTNSNVSHPAIMFEGNAYYGDGNLLLRQTSAGGAPATILTLPALTDSIQALGVDPGTGKMLISTTGGGLTPNEAKTIPARNLLQWYDGESATVSKYVDVGDPILSFKSVGSTTFVGWGRSLGFINGSGVGWLRDLKNVTYALEELPYQNKITSIGNTLYVVDGDQVLAYGNVPGIREKIFYYCLQNKVNSNKFRAIFPMGNVASSDSKKIGLSLDTTKLRTVDLTDTSGLDKFFFMTNWIHLPRPHHVYNMQLEFFSNLTSSANLTLTFSNQERTNNTITSLDGTITSVKVLRKFGGFHNKVDAFRLQIEDSTNNAGLKRILFYKKVAE